MSKNKKILLEITKGGMSQAAIAASLHVSKRDVSAAAKVVREHGLGFADVLAMDAAAIDDTFFPKTPRGRDESYLQPDMDELIERKKRNPKLPVKIFWYEHCGQASSEGKNYYSYQAFCEMFAAAAEKAGAARHFNHVAAAKAYVDWAGDPGKVVDKISGRASKVYVLVIVLPFSDYFWARGYADMKQASWLDGHMEAFEEFGGVPRLLVPDNCGTATDRGPLDVTKLNGDYERFAEHYGTAVLPARVRAPRDKNLAESTVNLVEQWVIAPSNEMTFYTIGEFNDWCAERVRWLNERPFSDKDGSRAEVFEAEERPLLQPLPPERYELCEWRRCKVAPDYHVRVAYMHYSVPHALIGREVDVRVTAKRVTVFDGGEAVADHARLHGRKGQYSTVVEHMPDNHAALESPWSAERFTSWADRIGPETGEAIRRIMSGREVVEQSFVPCRNVLGLSKRYGPAYLERACAASNLASTHPSYTGIKNMVLSIKAADAQAGPAPSSAHDAVADNAKSAGRVRGADAYRRPGKGGDGDADRG